MTRAQRGIPMEGRVARWYDGKAHRDVDEYRALARRVAARAAARSVVLEMAPGPGYFAIELAKLGQFTITGLDISETFVSMARQNATSEGVTVDFRRGDVVAMPFDGETFDFIVCRAALQNFSNPSLALKEAYRVLKIGGQAVLVDVRKDVSRQAINAHVRKVSAGLLDSVLNRWVFRLVLVRRAYGNDPLRALVAEAGFGVHDLREDPMNIEVWLHKPRVPER